MKLVLNDLNDKGKRRDSILPNKEQIKKNQSFQTTESWKLHIHVGSSTMHRMSSHASMMLVKFWDNLIIFIALVMWIVIDITLWTFLLLFFGGYCGFFPPKKKFNVFLELQKRLLLQSKHITRPPINMLRNIHFSWR